MKKILVFLLLLPALIGVAQDTEKEVVCVGFYNLENLFDTEHSVQAVSVEKYLEGDADYVTTFPISTVDKRSLDDIDETINFKFPFKKIDFENLPSVSTDNIEYREWDTDKFEKMFGKTLSKKELKKLLESNDDLFTKKEFNEFMKNNSEITVEKEFFYANVNDYDNSPDGHRQYTEELYEDKVSKLASVIKELGTEYTPDGAAILGVSEIENIDVLEDLVAHGDIADKGYEIIHYNSMDGRGVDVGMIYQPKYFTVENTEVIRFEDMYYDKKEESKVMSRDILWVEGDLLGEKVHVFVNHWPSRRAESRLRGEAAAQLKVVTDSLLKADPNVKVIVMGDLNDDPTSPSVKKVLEAKKKEKDVSAGDLYNPLYKDYKQGYGSLGYRGSINLFDQVIVSSAFLNEDENLLALHSAEIVYNQDWINRWGTYKNGNYRSFGGNTYIGGYSDHLPSVIYLTRNAMDDADKDGIADEDDACPDTPGLRQFDGCPDTDEDGVADKDDECPEVAGIDKFNGCPDTDEDGIHDGKDDCIDEVGPKENKGCPYADTDKDGIIDIEDKCPEEAGIRENKGCPEIKEEVQEALQLAFDNLVFDSGKSTIKSSSDDELENLAKILKENKSLNLMISGHTDSQGDDEANMTLSKNRANAVKERLESLGVVSSRMTTEWFGETEPVADNATAAGRAKNRRVVFVVKYY
ncbi:MAG: OmpA family protein [Chitinophagales bacterium]